MIMRILWKRLDDHGKNWRHVYKVFAMMRLHCHGVSPFSPLQSLALLEYMVRCGGDEVPRVVLENLFAIKTLREFQYISKEGKDIGLNSECC